MAFRIIITLLEICLKFYDLYKDEDIADLYGICGQQTVSIPDFLACSS